MLKLKYQMKMNYKKRILETFKCTMYSTVVHSSKLFLVSSVDIQRLELTYVHLHGR